MRGPVSLLHPGANSNSCFTLSVFKDTLHRVCISQAVKTLKPVSAGLGGDWTCYSQVYWTHLYGNRTFPQNKTSFNMSGCCQQQLRAGSWNFIFRGKQSLGCLSLPHPTPASARFWSFTLPKHPFAMLSIGGGLYFSVTPHYSQLRKGPALLGHIYYIILDAWLSKCSINTCLDHQLPDNLQMWLMRREM